MRWIRNSIARILRGLPVRGRGRLVPMLGRMFAAEPVLVDLPDLGPVQLDLRDEDQLGMFWMGLHPDDARIGRLIADSLPADGVFVDIGANIGLHTIRAARKLQPGGGSVFAFEPHPTNFATLTDNLTRQGLTCVQTENQGLSDEPGTLAVEGEVRGNWSIASRGSFHFDVRLSRLDDYIAGQPIHRIDVLKVDVEGAEVRVLRGAVETLRRFRPVVVFEVAPAWLKRMGTSVVELLGTVEDLGYDIHALPSRSERVGKRVRATDLAGMGPGDWTNLIGVPACVGDRGEPVALATGGLANC